MLFRSLFFILFIFTSTFIVVNLFVAVIVDSINSVKFAEAAESKNAYSDHDLQQLRQDVAELKAVIQSINNKLESR